MGIQDRVRPGGGVTARADQQGCERGVDICFDGEPDRHVGLRRDETPEEVMTMRPPFAAANGGGPSRLPSARLVAAVAEDAHEVPATHDSLSSTTSGGEGQGEEVLLSISDATRHDQ